MKYSKCERQAKEQSNVKIHLSNELTQEDVAMLIPQIRQHSTQTSNAKTTHLSIAP